ncbi:MAG: tyrosine--tRNA ligase [Euryarchaeota archaeon]|nr:tyrosine--tRNA ligase [Euryarchaeota archaeon]
MNMIDMAEMDATSIDAVLSPHLENCPRISELDEAQSRRLAWMLGAAEEIVGIDHLVEIILGGESAGGDDVIRCYVGFEPSGKAHIGWKVVAITLKRMLDAGANVLIFMADWHAWVNDKFGGDMEKIHTTATYMEDTFRVLLGNPPEGEGAGELRFLYASSIMDSGDYWARVLRCSKNMSLSKVRKTFTIMGRDEDAADDDLSKFFYPAMQAADIFEMNIDIALGGMDQRKAHMYMRRVADKWKWHKATCVHTPIISSLKAGARMETAVVEKTGGIMVGGPDEKMSKSDPSSAILLHDEAGKVRKKMKKHAYLDPSDERSTVYELLEHIILPEMGELNVVPNPKFGEPSKWHEIDAIRAALGSGELHPLDVKFAVADALSDGLARLAEHFEMHPEKLAAVSEITG